MIDIVAKMFAYLCLENYNQVCISEENIKKYFKIFYKILIANIDNIELISLFNIDGYDEDEKIILKNLLKDIIETKRLGYVENDIANIIIKKDNLNKILSKETIITNDKIKEIVILFINECNNINQKLKIK